MRDLLLGGLIGLLASLISLWWALEQYVLVSASLIKHG
jgi:hypothetical protein